MAFVKITSQPIVMPSKGPKPRLTWEELEKRTQMIRQNKERMEQDDERM